jgi:hypothetical protein
MIHIKNFIKIFEMCCQTKIFQLVMILIMNLGSMYLSKDIKFFMDYIFSFCIMKFLIIFAISITVTKDLIISVCATLAAGILLFFILNKDSKMCLLSNSYIQKVEHFYQRKQNKIKKNHKNTKKS